MCGADALVSPALILTRRKRRVRAISGSAAVVEVMATAVPHNPVSTGMAALALEEFLDSIGLPSRSGRALHPVPVVDRHDQPPGAMINVGAS
jgi:hypothetical protein